MRDSYSMIYAKKWQHQIGTLLTCRIKSYPALEKHFTNCMLNETWQHIPTPDKWCDALLQGEYVTEKMFKCPGNKKARCSYSINPNCEPNSEPNTVLVFESKGGWNSFGGPELFNYRISRTTKAAIFFIMTAM